MSLTLKIISSDSIDPYHTNYNPLELNVIIPMNKIPELKIPPYNILSQGYDGATLQITQINKPKDSIISNISSRKQIRKYTLPCGGSLDIFLERAREVHGNKFDYSQIRPEHIQGATSHIPILCKTCGYNWSPSINNHINKIQGCPKTKTS